MDATPTCFPRPPAGPRYLWTALALLALTTFGIASIAPAQADPPPPEVESVSPDHGPLSGGTSVTITGSGFTEATAVKFGFADAESFTIESDTEVTAVAPKAEGAVGEGHVADVTVTGPGGTSHKVPADRFAYGPVITEIQPTFGPAAGGTAVTLSGFNLEETSAVNFGPVPAESFSVNPDGSVTAVAPPTEPGETVVAVTAITPEGASDTPWVPDTSHANYFTYGPTVTGVTPDQGPAAGGTVVTIHGTGFKSPLPRCLCPWPFVQSVSFGATALECGLPYGPAQIPCSPVVFEVLSDTEITAVAPPGTGSVTIAAETDGGASPLSPAVQFTYIPSEPPPPPPQPEESPLLSCVLSKESGAKATGSCSSRSAASGSTAGPVKVRLFRGKTLYARGTARVHRHTTHLLLEPLKRVKAGRYELVLSRKSGEAAHWTRRESVLIR